MIFGMPVDVTWDGPDSFSGVRSTYWRLKSDQKLTPPYSFTGKMRLHEVMDPPIFGSGWREGQIATYNPGINFHVMYPSNDRNIVIGIGRRSNPEHVAVSAEMRDVRPERPYGVRTGYEIKKVSNISDPMDGKWHSFRCEVISFSHYQLWWDGSLVADVVEKSPVTIDNGFCSVGLRLDFCHIEMAEMKVMQHLNSVVEKNFEVVVSSPFRVYDSRDVSRHKAGETRKIKVVFSDAAFVNIVAVAPEDDGYLTVWGGGPRPNSSHVNFSKGTDIANGVWVPVMSDGCVNVYTHKGCHVVLDVLATA